MKITNLKSFSYFAVLTAIVLIFTTSCYKKEIIPGTDIVSGEGLEDWGSNTHSGDASTNYDIVFPQDKVNRIDVVIPSDDWEAMLQDLTNNVGAFGTGSTSMAASSDIELAPGPGGPGHMNSFTPVFSKASVFFNSMEWYNVGVRFKGNSSLKFAWQAGIMKLAFRFDFDEHEDEFPEMSNQSYYGFQKISFSSNYNDQSFLNEKLAADIFREAGLKAPKTAYYRIYVDHGTGPVYFGLYTAVEIVEDTMLDDQFGSGAGNCYKPQGDGATFAYGTFNTTDFDLKTNEDIADYSDVEALYNILHSSTRNTDIEQWKTELEAVFDVNHFMKWLATNNTIINWDTYGVMSHNYYIYNNPYTNKIVWIPWDNNMALCEGKRDPLSLSMNEVTNEWPLISYLIEIDEYKQIYEGHLQSVIDGAFIPSKVQEKFQYYHNLIYDYVIGADGEQSGYTFLNSASDFTNALNERCNHVDERYGLVTDYLAK